MTKEGTVLDGKYEILAEVGRGGMSIVYLARDKRLNKQWAVKEIKNDGKKSTKTLLKGLEREANILKNVDHPVLPRIVDIINQEGTIYVVMDFIEGDTIQDRLKKEGAQPQDLVIEWGLQLASALDYLHNMNPPVIYRDMKPSNVMIKPEGGVKLIDFGTAKEYEIENNADTTALGTRGYAAPEQFGDAQGRGIYNTDARTDIYNLGATLYHIVTGKNPCEPPYEIKPIREWNPMLSSGLEKIILKCTQADPKDRYQNCTELMYALEHYDELDDAYRKKNKQKMAAFAAAVSIVVVGGVTALVGHNGLQKIKLDNYNTYIEAGNDYRVEGDYISAAEQYKKAFELDGSDSEAYEKFIQVYVDASNEIKEEGETADLDLESGLNVVANKIKAKYAGVDTNSAVLYRLGLAYFDNLKDYKTAAVYFDKVDKNDEDYGELAQYYKSIATIRSSANVDAGDLMEEVNSFAKYNQDNFTNQDERKFVNYRVIGEIYATYATTAGVADQALVVMEQAVEDLDQYNGTEITTEKINDYYYNYYDNLIVINDALAKANSNMETLSAQYYSNEMSYIDDFLNILNIKVEESYNAGIGGTYDNAYNKAYYNKMMAKASCYYATNKYDKVISTYEEIEKALGKDNNLSNKVYAEHLDFLYVQCENKEQDPNNWPSKMSAEVDQLVALYNAGKNVKDIDSNKTWKKRKDVLEMLASGNYKESKPAEDDTVQDAAGNAEMGE